MVKSYYSQSDKNCQSASYKLRLKNLTAIFYPAVNSNGKNSRKIKKALTFVILLCIIANASLCMPC